MEQIWQQYDEEVKDRYSIDLVGRLALVFLEKWGMVTGFANGEDKANRSVLDLLPVDQTVDRAFAMAKLCTERLQAEGCLRDLGPLKDRKIMMQSYDAYRLVPVTEKGIFDDIRPGDPKRRTIHEPVAEQPKPQE